MARTLAEIKSHLRMVIANQSVSTTLIQTEDLAALCDAADERDHWLQFVSNADKMQFPFNPTK